MKRRISTTGQDASMSFLSHDDIDTSEVVLRRQRRTSTTRKRKTTFDDDIPNRRNESDNPQKERVSGRRPGDSWYQRRLILLLAGCAPAEPASSSDDRGKSLSRFAFHPNHPDISIEFIYLTFLKSCNNHSLAFLNGSRRMANCFRTARTAAAPVLYGETRVCWRVFITPQDGYHDRLKNGYYY